MINKIAILSMAVRNVSSFDSVVFIAFSICFDFLLYFSTYADTLSLPYGRLLWFFSDTYAWRTFSNNEKVKCALLSS